MPHMYTVIYAGDIVVQTSGMYACNTMHFLAHILNFLKINTHDFLSSYACIVWQQVYVNFYATVLFMPANDTPLPAVLCVHLYTWMNALE